MAADVPATRGPSPTDHPIDLASCHSMHAGASTAPDCRICFDTGSAEDLVAPCDCKGSLRYVHMSCLLRWAMDRASSGATRGSLRCEVCGGAFSLPAGMREELLRSLEAGEQAK